jgi:hypothetical protein
LKQKYLKNFSRRFLYLVLNNLYLKLNGKLFLSSLLTFQRRDTIIELVDSISRDGPNTPIYYVIHYKHPNISEQVILWRF